jgi:hypothetical protein
LNTKPNLYGVVIKGLPVFSKATCCTINWYTKSIMYLRSEMLVQFTDSIILRHKKTNNFKWYMYVRFITMLTHFHKQA